ncbi:MAG: Ig-like domain-containing protein, partial [Pseudomonadota bacterium]
MAGSDANDVIRSGDGVDLILSGAGDDHIDGGDQADILLAGEGDDTAIGGDGDDTISGQAGADLLIGGNGADVIRETGFDENTLFGGAGDDTLRGGDGVDTLVGGAGSDDVAGGGGGDIFLLDLQQQQGSVDTLSGGAGVDEVRVVFTDVQSFQAFSAEVDAVGFVTALANAGFIVVDDGANDQIELFTIVPVGLGPIVGAPLDVTASEQDAVVTVDLLSGTEDPLGLGLSIANFRANDDGGPAFTLVGDSFVLDPEQFDFLTDGEFREFSFQYDIVDADGLSVNQDLTVTVTGANSPVTINFGESILDVDIATGGAGPPTGFIDFEDFAPGTLEPITDGFVTISTDTGNQRIQAQNFVQIPGVFEGQFFGFSASSYFIDFDSPVSFVSFGLFDLNTTGGTVTAFDAFGAVVEELTIGVDIPIGPPGGSTSQLITFTSGSPDISQIVVDPLGGDLTGIDQLTYGDGSLGGTAIVAFDDPDAGDVHFAEILNAEFVGDTSGLPAGLLAEDLLSLAVQEPGQGSGFVTVDATLDPALLDVLADGQSLTIDATIEVSDAGGTTAVADVTFSFLGENNPPVLIDAQSNLQASAIVQQIDLSLPTGVIDFEDEVSGAGEPFSDGFATVSTLDGNGVIQPSGTTFPVELINDGLVFGSQVAPIVIEFDELVDSVGLGVTAALSSNVIISIFDQNGEELESQDLNELARQGSFEDAIAARAYFSRDTADIARVEVAAASEGEIAVDEIRYGFGALLTPTVNATFFDVDGVDFEDTFVTFLGDFTLEGSPLGLDFPPIAYAEDEFQFINATGDSTATRQTTLAIENNLFGFLAEGESIIAELPTQYSDDQDQRVDALFEFEIIGVNDAPLAANDFAVTDEETIITVDLVLNDIDIDQDLLTVIEIEGQAASQAPITLASGAIVQFNGNGTIDYDPSTSAINDALEFGESRIETISYTVTDPGGETSTAELQIQVNGAGDFNVVPLNFFGAFNPNNSGSLYGIGVNPNGTEIAVITQQAATVDFYAPDGTFLRSIPLPGDRGNDGDLEFLETELTLNGVDLPAGTLLVMSGDSGTADIFAVDPADGTVLQTLATDFGNNFTVGITHNAVTGTLFLLSCNCSSVDNVIAEIDPADGTTLNLIELDPLDFQTFFGDLDSDPVTGDLFVVSDQEPDILRLNTDGVVLERLELPAGANGLSGVSV